MEIRKNDLMFRACMRVVSTGACFYVVLALNLFYHMEKEQDFIRKPEIIQKFLVTSIFFEHYGHLAILFFISVSTS